MTPEQTIEGAAFAAAFKDACTECIAAARRLRSRMVARDEDAFVEFGRIAGGAMARAGATKDEGTHYATRILEAVLAEPQA